MPTYLFVEGQLALQVIMYVRAVQRLRRYDVELLDPRQLLFVHLCCNRLHCRLVGRRADLLLFAFWRWETRGWVGG